MADGEVIGGTSFPLKEGELLMGSAYSLDGMTLEEVTGLTFKEWSDDWKKGTIIKHLFHKEISLKHHYPL